MCLFGECKSYCDAGDLTCYCDESRVCQACMTCPVNPGPPNVTTVHCENSNCEITLCNEPFRDINQVFGDGCECRVTDIFLARDGSVRDAPRMAAGGSGQTAGVVWEDRRSGHSQIYFDRVVQTGESLQEFTDVLLQASPLEEGTQPSITWNGRSGNFDVVWIGGGTIKFVPVSATGVRGSEVNVLAGWGQGVPRTPAIASGSAGNLLAYSVDNTKIWIAFIGDNGSPDFDPGHELPVGHYNAQVATADQPVDMRVVASGDSYLVAWEEGGGSSHQIRFVIVTATWVDQQSFVSVTAPQSVQQWFSGFSDPRHLSAMAGGGGMNDAFWIGFDANSLGRRNIWMARIATDGQVSDTSAVTQARDSSTASVGGAPARGPSGTIGVFWSERGQKVEEQSLSYRPLNGGGTPITEKAFKLLGDPWDVGPTIYPTQSIYQQNRFNTVLREVQNGQYGIRYVTICGS